MWNRDGVEREEARSALSMLGSTVYPVAHEMAEWLYENWSLKQIDDLGHSYRRLFMTAIGDAEYSAEPNPNRDLPRAVIDRGSLKKTHVIRLEYRRVRGRHRFLHAVMTNGNVFFGETRYPDIDAWLAAVASAPEYEDGRRRPELPESRRQERGPWRGEVEVFHNGWWAQIVNIDSLPREPTERRSPHV